MVVFHIGGVEAEYVRVSDIRDNRDGWFTASVQILVGAFRANFSAYFNSSAFSNFEAQLQTLDQTLSGSATFTSYEGQLELQLTCDAKGHVEVNGEATDYAGFGSKLTFRLCIDQTHLPAIRSDLRSALLRYPPSAV